MTRIFCQAVEIDGILYLSGQIGLDAVTGEMAQGVEEQAMLALTNMQHIMEVAGIGFSNVIKATVFLADINDFDTVNQVYEKFFVEHFPARAAVQVTCQISFSSYKCLHHHQVANLPKGALVEIEAVAVVGDDIDTQYVSG